MGHGDVEPAALGDVAGAHLARHGAADDVAGGALQARVVALHEARPVAAQKIAAGAAQALLQHGAGHPRAGAGIEARRVELHHLHVAQRQARLQRHRHAVAGLVARRRVVAVHGGAAAGREQHGLRPHEAQRARADVDQQHAGEPRAVAGGDQRRRPVLLQPRHRPRPDLLHQPVDDLDAGQVPLVDGAVEGLPGERLLVDAAVGIAVEIAADLVFQLADALDRALDQRPGELLVVDPGPALDRVHEMSFEAVAGRERHIVAALHHAGAAALAEQALGGDGDIERRVGAVGVQGGEQPRTPGAEDQDVALHPLDHAKAAARKPKPASSARPPAARSATAGGRTSARTQAAARAGRPSGAAPAARPAPPRRA